MIRGPGTTLWGANAVNGVINVITKKATVTQGGLVVGRAGTEEQCGFTGMRYGTQLTNNTYARAYGKFFLPETIKPQPLETRLPMRGIGARRHALGPYREQRRHPDTPGRLLRWNVWGTCHVTHSGRAVLTDIGSQGAGWQETIC